MSTARHHAEWLSLLDISGPFLSMPVLLRALPHGLNQHSPAVLRTVRHAHTAWADNQRGPAPDPAIHAAWVRLVLTDVLGYPPALIAEGAEIPATLKATVDEERETIRADLIIRRADRNEPPRLLLQVVPATQHLEKPLAGARWKASPATRLAELLRVCDVRLGLLTNGEQWMLVHAPRGEISSFISWYATVWQEEPITLRSFCTLLEMHRCYGVAPEDTLEALLTESTINQQEVTDQLGYQVRQAVEMLVQTIDRVDKDTGRVLLRDTPETLLYEAALTVMMRLVFLFCAEERDLLRLGDTLYDQHYAVSTLRATLREAADRTGEEVLERRHDAWCRLLAMFRLVYGGANHHALSMPAYGGSLFDPDRYPFLEGRPQRVQGAGFGVQDAPRAEPEPSTLNPEPSVRPLMVDNRTVLHLLDALQILRVKMPGGGPAEPRRLSFRALDIEQIGHVYEGLLDHTAERASEPVLGLVGTRDHEPEIPLSMLEDIVTKEAEQAAQSQPPDPPRLSESAALLAYLKEQTGRSPSALRKALDTTLSRREYDRIRSACDNDEAVFRRLRPYAGLLRWDTFERPVVITAGSVYVTGGVERRKTGTHYTPRSLTESVVQHALDPLVYDGPAEGLPREQWRLRTPAHILGLRVCDMAMGSGAFLVQACRYLAERLVESWEEQNEGFRVQGSGDREHWEGVTDDGVAIVPRPDRLAAEHGPGGGSIPHHALAAEGGIVQPDQPDAPRGDIHSVEHRGGLRAAASQGIRESPVNRAGFAAGGGDADTDSRQAGVHRPGAGQSSVESLPGSGTVTQWLDALFGGQPPENIAAGGAGDGQGGHPEPSSDDPEERLTAARRLVANCCLYGVDKNPLAVEIAKLSLWLTTLQKDRPFTFLDHALKCGDSLLGVSVAQLERWSLDTEGAQTTYLTYPIQRARERATALRRRIAETPVFDVSDTEEKADLLRQADDALALVLLAADLLAASALLPEKAQRETFEAYALDRLQLLATAWEDIDAGHATPQREQYIRDEFAALRAEAVQWLQSIRPFHWELEFPEVFEGSGDRVQGSGDRVQGSGADLLNPTPYTLHPESGFAALVGNPPFMGGQRITGGIGTAYRDYLVEHLAGGKRGSADLCAYFFLRTRTLLQRGGMAGLLATNTIAQGDTREVGLDQLVRLGYSIPRAVPSRKWPGAAGVEVAHVWLRRGSWQAGYVLDDTPVAGITPYLTVPGKSVGVPHRLAANADKSFQGSIVLGMGFVLEPDEAQALIEHDPRNRDVLFPYLNGQDLNSNPDQSPSRWVINFQDWPLEQAEQYPDCMAIVREKVKPEREKQKDKGGKQFWWRFLRPRPELHATIAGMERVLVRARIANMHSVAYVPNGWVYNEKTVVFAHCPFALLQSNIHEIWAREYSSSLKSDMQYTPSDCFETFPFPAGLTGSEGAAPEPRTLNPEPLQTNPEPLQTIGERYHTHRQQVMLARQEGLTKTYNRFHDPDETSDDIALLRHLHTEMDAAVAAAYGWGDLHLAHGFHDTKQGMRYTLSEAARREVLDRLLALNHERHAAEVAAGLHDKRAKKGTSKGKAKGKSGGQRELL